MPILGRPMLERQVERLRRAHRIQTLVLATSTDKSDDPLAELAENLGLVCFRGSLNDVLDRFYLAAKQSCAPTIMRLTADCPLADPVLIDRVIEFFVAGEFDYVSSSLVPTFPDGLDVEVVRFSCVEEAWREAWLPSEREHVLPYIYEKPDRFKLGVFTSDVNRSHLRWTVDEPEDLELVTRIFEALYPTNPAFSTADVLALLERQPELARLNAHHVRNAGGLCPAGNPS